MALTITLNAHGRQTAGHKVRVEGTALFDSSYAASGEALTAANLGLRVIDSIQFETVGGITPRFDYTNNLLLAFYSPFGTLAALGTSIASGTSTTTQALYTYTVPAGLLNAAGQGLLVEFWGTSAANTTNKTALATFGTQLLVTTGSTAINNVSWHLTGTLIGVNVSALEVLALAEFDTTLAARTRSAPGGTLSTTQTLALQVVTAVSGHLTLQGYRINLINPVTSFGQLAEVIAGTDLSGVTTRFVAWGI